MLGKLWKKIGIIILIIACLWNIIFKLVNKISFDNIIDSAKAQVQEMKNKSKK